jgi:O-antigen/teichoic acid export membrane protein
LDVLYTIIPGEYEKGKMVIYFIGLANIFNMATGTNGIIIATSSYYRYQSVFVFLLLLFTIATNALFIPKFGITGAAIASAISTFLFNLIRYLFILRKFNFQPFNWRFLAVTIIGAMILYSFNKYVHLSNLYLDFTTNSALITLIYGSFIYLFKISDDINKIIQSVMGLKDKK